MSVMNTITVNHPCTNLSKISNKENYINNTDFYKVTFRYVYTLYEPQKRGEKKVTVLRQKKKIHLKTQLYCLPSTLMFQDHFYLSSQSNLPM